MQPPEEFLDPLTQDIMVDPVILPTSGHTIDRSSIMRHLLRYFCHNYSDKKCEYMILLWYIVISKTPSIGLLSLQMCYSQIRN